MDESKLAGFGLLGLHRLVASRGDGLVPELYDALMREALWREDHPNVVKFPAWATRRPGDAAETPVEAKVLAFALPVVEKRDERQAR